jgi:hypothetical protein
LMGIRNRINIILQHINGEGSASEFSIYIYFDNKTSYNRHLAVAPLALIKRLAKHVNVDYHNLQTLKHKLYEISSKTYVVKSIRVESIEKYALSSNDSRSVDEHETIYAIRENLTNYPARSMLVDKSMDENGYRSELYYPLAGKENGQLVPPPSSVKPLASKVYLGKGSDIMCLSLYIIGSSTGKKDNSTLYTEITLQKNENNSDLSDNGKWINVTTKAYYIDLYPEQTYVTLNLPKDQLGLENNEYYRIIIKFLWIYGSQSRLYSAILGVGKVYKDTRLLGVPGHPSATTSITQTNKIMDYFDPSRENPLSKTIILKPLSGTVNNTYSLHINMHIWINWKRTSTVIPSFTIKIYVNGILKKTNILALSSPREENLSLAILLHRSDFIYKKRILITYLVERSPSEKIYGFLEAEAYVNSVRAFPDVWNTDNPYPYILGGLPKIQRTLVTYVKTRRFNDTITSSLIVSPIVMGHYCSDPSVPVIRTYYSIHDDAGIRSWRLTIRSPNPRIIPYVAVAANPNPTKTPYITYIIRELTIGINTFLAGITSGLNLIPQFVVQLAAGTVTDLVSFFTMRLSSQGLSIREEHGQWVAEYMSSYGQNQKDLRAILLIGITDSSFYDCRSAPSGYTVKLIIGSNSKLYFMGDEQYETYIYVYRQAIPGYYEPANYVEYSYHGIRHG